MGMAGEITINGRSIGPGREVYVVAEMSANHLRDLARAKDIVRAAGDAGADAIKVQLIDPKTMTIDANRAEFRVGADMAWRGYALHDLYTEACMPWGWYPLLRNVADECELDLFATAYDSAAVDFLTKERASAIKVASFELIDIPFLRRVGAAGKPVILSTGMATLAEIEEAVETLRDAGADGVALLKCTSAYPAPPDVAHLRTIPHMAEAFGAPVGLSDHTRGIAVSVAAVAIGACIIERHLTLARADGGPDATFSLEPGEFSGLVNSILDAEQSLGGVRYGPTDAEEPALRFRRSLYVTEDVRKGDEFSNDSVRSIRPAGGLHPRHIDVALSARAACDAKAGTPLTWDMLDWSDE